MRKEVVASLLKYLDTDTVWSVKYFSTSCSTFWTEADRPSLTQLPRRLPPPARRSAGCSLEASAAVGA